jgi:integrase
MMSIQKEKTMVNATLRDVLENDYAPLRGLKAKAILQYRLTLDRFAEHLGREPEVSDLQGITVQQFLTARKTKVSAATVQKDRCQICALWSHLFRLRRVEVAPAAVLPPMRAPKRVPRAYRDHEISAILKAALATPGSIDGRPASIWHASLIRAAFETAERIGALLAVEWRDVDFAEKTILLRAENRKGAHADLLRPVSDQTLAWISTLRQTAGDRRRVWNWDRWPTHLWYQFRQICKRAGTRDAPVQCRGYHGFRKASASYIAAAAGLGEAAAALGHSSPVITQQHYVDQTIARPGRTYLDMLPKLDIGGQPPDPAGEAQKAALEAGRQAGRGIASRGEPCPVRASVDVLAAAAGIAAEEVPQYRRGLVAGWTEGQECPPVGPPEA